jgi:hypothetical protein
MQLDTGWKKSKKATPAEWAKSRENDLAKGFTQEAVHRFAERHPERFYLRDGKPIGAVPRLKQALSLIRQGRYAAEYKARSGTIQDRNDDTDVVKRRIFDVELPADASGPEPYVIRVLTDEHLRLIITVLPPESRKSLCKTKARLQRKEFRLVDDEIVEEFEVSEKVELPPSVKCTGSLADAFRKAGVNVETTN